MEQILGHLLFKILKMFKKNNKVVSKGSYFYMRLINSKGFTIIELIIAISIIALISTIGIASFAGRGKIAELDAAINSVSSYLQLARSRAISQVKPQDPVICTGTLEGYKVVISQANNSYELDIVCGGTTSKISEEVLPTNFSFDNDTTSTSFFFPILTHGVNGSGVISISGYGKKKTITVDSVGGINIK
jgi:type IV fimbrial biogenesis protein FimT